MLTTHVSCLIALRVAIITLLPVCIHLVDTGMVNCVRGMATRCY